MRYLNNVQDLTLGSLYELDVTSWQARVPWFKDKNRTDHNCVTPPANGTYVVYLGKYAGHATPYYRLLSSDGNIYRIYNTNFVHGLKETNKPRRKTTTKKIPRLTSVEEAMERTEEIPRRCIEAFSNVGDLVYDPFMGSGTTAKVAADNNRNWIGSEISQNYVEMVKNRVGA